ncbi:hypothetical protein, partial [Pseudomonas aeruginosa]|uniref:hypothetical protein n=1 Tax=Pseudomonas aeruginosa TaxID=287 RepID=UPI003F51F501
TGGRSTALQTVKFAMNLIENDKQDLVCIAYARPFNFDCIFALNEEVRVGGKHHRLLAAQSRLQGSKFQAGPISPERDYESTGKVLPLAGRPDAAKDHQGGQRWY